MNPPISNIAARDVEHVTHPYSNPDALREPGPIVITKGKGVHIHDVNGNKYIDVLAGLWCTALGHGNLEIAEAIYEQSKKLSFGHLFGLSSHDVAGELAEKIVQLAPHNAKQVLFCCSGSEANDQQVKLLRYFNNLHGRPEKKKIISRQRGYHGVTLASASLAGLPFNHSEFDLPLDFSVHADCPHHYQYSHKGESEDEFVARLVQNLKDLIEREDPNTIAAFIAEPVMGAGGAIIPPKSYFPKIEPVLRENNIRIISDEVICGFGRTGEMFGAQTFGFTPDSISIAKALTSAYIPLGGVTLDADMADAVAQQSRKIGVFGHGFTYAGHPTAAAAALKALEIYERDNIVKRVQAMAEPFANYFQKLADHPLVGNVRSVGLIGAVELAQNKADRKPFPPDAKAAAAAVNIGFKNGLFLRAVGNDILPVCPPLIISHEEMDDLFGRFTKTLDVLQQNLAADGYVPSS